AAGAARTSSMMELQQRHLPTLGDFMQVTVPILQTSNGRDSASADIVDSRPSRGSVHLLGYLTVGIAQNFANSELHRISVISLGLGLGIFALCLPLATALV